MKIALLAGLVASALCAAPSFAQEYEISNWTAVDNGEISAVMPDSNHVMMKITVPHAAFMSLKGDMNNGNNGCRIQNIYPGVTDTMILVCGGPGG